MSTVRNINGKRKEKSNDAIRKHILDLQEANKIIEALRFCAR